MKIENLMVTGGCGFIGTNFIRHLLEKPDFSGRIINLDKVTYAGNPENLIDLEERYPGRYVFQKADICDADSIKAIFSEYQVDAICHFAAESHVDRSIKNPGSFIHSNIIGTFNLLEVARADRDRFQLFHHISTDEVYGSLGPEGLFTEETPYRPNSPYSASKAASDHLVRAYHETFGLPTTISNCSNNYGPYQFPEKLIPLIIMNALEWKPLPVYGDGKNIRDWLYVTDHCEAIWTIMQAGKHGETYNIGGNSEMENITIVEMICDILADIRPSPDRRSRRDLIAYVTDRPGHDRRYAIDFTKLNKSLGWRPQESFQSGLHKTIQWYLDHRTWCERIKSGEYRQWLQAHYGQA
jgi:dTDP-glucose 4,6-dehydratase